MKNGFNLKILTKWIIIYLDDYKINNSVFIKFSKNYSILLFKNVYKYIGYITKIKWIINLEFNKNMEISKNYKIQNVLLLKIGKLDLFGNFKIINELI